MKNIFLSICALTLSALLTGQSSLDLLTVSGRYGLPQSYDSLYSNKATEKVLLINIKMPVPFSEKTIWYNDLTYTSFNVNNDNTMPAGIANPIHLHGFILQTGLYKKFSEGRGLQLLFAPRFMTDMQHINGTNFQMGGIAMYEKRYHEGLMLRFGAMLTDELGGPLLVPIVYTDWQIGTRWSVVGMWPIFGKVIYQASENFSTGFSHFGLITSFRMGSPDYQDDYIERRSIDLAWFGRLRVAGNLHLEGRAGYALGRAYEQYAPDQKVDFRVAILKFGDNRTAKNVAFNPGPIINLRLVYNLPL